MSAEIKTQPIPRNYRVDVRVAVLGAVYAAAVILSLGLYPGLHQILDWDATGQLTNTGLGIALMLPPLLCWFAWRRWRDRVERREQRLRHEVETLREAEKSARAEIERLRDAIEAMPEGFALYNADERLVICNQPYRDTLPRIASMGLLNPGAKLEDNIKAGIKKGFIPESYKSPEEFLSKRLDMFRNPTGPFEYATTKGQWIQCEERKTPSGETVAMRLDITDRKQADQALHESEQRLVDAVESLPLGFVLFDDDDRLVLWNSSIAEILPWLKGKLIKEAPYESLLRVAVAENWFPDAAGRAEEWIAEQLERFRNPSSEPRELVLKDGRTLLTVERKTTDGGTVGIRIDIAERKAVEEQLRQAQKMEVVGQLTGGIAHDFNNLLGVIIGNLDLVLQDAEDSELCDMIETSQRAAMQAAELTSRLLAFSRKQPLHPVPADLNQLIEDMSDLLSRTLDETIDIQFIASPDLKQVEVDTGQLEAALLNLAINACHAMPDGGRLTIETANIIFDHGCTEIPEELEPGIYAVLAVSDTGVGMSAEVLEQVFEPFFTTKDVGQGSGLGLSMVFGFVSQSGGHIAIESEEGEGTSVKLYFPTSDKEAPLPDKACELAMPALASGETVLIVEDDAGLRELAIKAVSSLGYKVIAAPDGPSALAELEQGAEIDVLFTDVVLPNGMDGIELGKVAVERLPGLRVLYTSGYTGRAAAQRGVLDKALDLVDKPYSREELARRLHRVLARSD